MPGIIREQFITIAEVKRARPTSFTFDFTTNMETKDCIGYFLSGPPTQFLYGVPALDQCTKDNKAHSN
jgi:hypothetical protein